MKHLALYLLLLSVVPALAQPRIEWQHVLGGNGNEDVFDMIDTNDGGLLLVGYTTSSQNGDVRGVNNGNKDFWIVKLDNSPKPKIQWEKNFGTEKEEVAYKAIKGDDGHFIVIGKTGRYTNDDARDTANNYDYWLLELDKNGDTLRSSTFGSRYADDYNNKEGLDDFTQIELLQTRDKKYLIFLGDVSVVEKNIFYHTDAWWRKMDWKTWELVAEEKLDFDGPGGLFYHSLISGLVELNDGNFLICALSTIDNNQKDEYWLQQVNANGKFSKPTKNFGGSGDDYPRDMIVDSDGNYLVIGESRSSDRDVIGNYRQKGQIYPSRDMWLLKVDKNMDRALWSKSFGYHHDDAGFSIIQAEDGSYYLGGFSLPFSIGGDVCQAYGNGEFFIVKLKKNGETEWTANFGGGGGEGIHKMFERNGKLLVAGFTNSGNGDVDVNQYKGGNDIWLVQLENLECNSLDQPLPRPEVKKTILGNSIKIEVVNTPPSPPGMQYRWKSSERDTFTETPWIIVPLDDPNIYTIRFKYLCCLSEPALTVPIQPASTSGRSWTITPNGDSKNDTFAPSWLLEGSATLQVFNLQGQRIFEAESYNNDWDGTFQGQPLPKGTYLYLIRLKEDGKIYRGTINIRR